MAAFRSSVPHHFAVPFSKVAEDAVASLDGRSAGSSASFDGFERTAIALFRPASESENESPSCLLSEPYRAFELV
jgi:hypothetical protein